VIAHEYEGPTAAGIDNGNGLATEPGGRFQHVGGILAKFNRDPGPFFPLTSASVENLCDRSRVSLLFSSTPPAPEFRALTPATSPAALAPIFAEGFGSPNLVTNTYRLSFLRDAQAAPDGGFPSVSTGVPAVSPTNTLRQALKTNDLRNWTPTAPVLLCAGDQDPTVFYLNTQLMQGYWTANAPSASVTVLDVDAAVTSGDPYADLKRAFAAAKARLPPTRSRAARAMEAPWPCCRRIMPVSFRRFA
jgi:hypothetical protein